VVPSPSIQHPSNLQVASKPATKPAAKNQNQQKTRALPMQNKSSKQSQTAQHSLNRKAAAQKKAAKNHTASHQNSKIRKSKDQKDKAKKKTSIYT
jgi:hypothetical protein